MPCSGVGCGAYGQPAQFAAPMGGMDGTQYPGMAGPYGGYAAMYPQYGAYPMYPTGMPAGMPWPYGPMPPQAWGSIAPVAPLDPNADSSTRSRSRRKNRSRKAGKKAK